LDESLKFVLPSAAPEAVLVDAVADPVAVLRGRADDVRVIGPGLGATKRTSNLVLALLAEALEGCWVIDADALNVLAGNVEALRERNGPMVLTPHPGEASRLLQREIPRDEAGRVAAAREIGRRAHAVCCLKGHRTVVVDGDRAYVNETGNSGMATAGAGDVLCGILGAYLALVRTRPDPGWTPFAAASSSVYIHGLAGDLAAAETGRRGLIASDLVRSLPAAQSRLHWA